MILTRTKLNSSVFEYTTLSFDPIEPIVFHGAPRSNYFVHRSTPPAIYIHVPSFKLPLE